MKKKSLLFIFLMMLISSFKVNNSYAVTNEDNAKTLKGIKSIYIVFEDFAQKKGEIGIKELGITEEQIIEKMELKLRLAGIKIISREECLKTKGSPLLLISSDIYLRGDSFGYVIFITLNQNVLLERNTKLQTSAITWNHMSYGIIGKNNTSDKILKLIDEISDLFLNDYLSVNPKK